MHTFISPLCTGIYSEPTNLILVWNMQTGKCQRTFKHKAPVWAVAISHELCITGCEQGKVKVWDIKSGDLVKVGIGGESTGTHNDIHVVLHVFRAIG